MRKAGGRGRSEATRAHPAPPTLDAVTPARSTAFHSLRVHQQSLLLRQLQTLWYESFEVGSVCRRQRSARGHRRRRDDAVLEAAAPPTGRVEQSGRLRGFVDPQRDVRAHDTTGEAPDPIVERPAEELAPGERADRDGVPGAQPLSKRLRLGGARNERADQKAGVEMDVWRRALGHGWLVARSARIR